MARISGRRERLVLRWACACAVVVIAIGISVALLRPDGCRPTSSPAPKMAKTSVPTPQKAPMAMPTPVTRPELRVSKPEMSWSSRHSGHHKLNIKRYASESHRHKAPPVGVTIPPVHGPAKEKPKPAVTSPSDDGSALAYATWQTGSERGDSYQYSYTTTDPATGEVTKCTVKYEGSAVEISMESDPAKPEKKPGKRNKINETI